MEKKIKIKKPKKGYWYLFVTTECVLCGGGEEYKIRVYDKPRPVKDEDRYEYQQFVHGEHFL